MRCEASQNSSSALERALEPFYSKADCFSGETSPGAEKHHRTAPELWCMPRSCSIQRGYAVHQRDQAGSFDSLQNSSRASAIALEPFYAKEKCEQGHLCQNTVINYVEDMQPVLDKWCIFGNSDLRVCIFGACLTSHVKILRWKYPFNMTTDGGACDQIYLSAASIETNFT